MFWIFAITIVGVNIAPFILPKLDIWHAQGFFIQLGIMVLFSWSFFEKKTTIVVKNTPLGLIHLWLGLTTAYYCYHSQLRSTYNLVQFLPYFNFLCMLILYRMIIEHLNRAKIIKILIYMRWMLIATLLLCTLQFFELAQFFEYLAKDTPQFHTFLNNLVTGFIGNGTHLSGFLAMCLPLLLIGKKRENILSCILLLIILTQAGTSKNDPSISGFIIAVCIGYYLLYFKRRKTFWKVVVGTIALCIPGFIILNGTGVLAKFTSLQGRIHVWRYYFPYFKAFPLTGIGVGSINQVFKQVGAPNARHLHLEFYHFAVELGLIGLILIINLIKDFFRGQTDDKIEVILQAMVLGFCVSCLFNFPAHLWLTTTYAIFAYAGTHTLRNEKLAETKGKSLWLQ